MSHRLGFVPLLFALALPPATQAGAPVCTVAPPGQIYWLRGEGNADDAAGYYNGGIGGSVEFVPGKVGRALRFDAIADHVGADVTPAEMRRVRNTFSYTFWARPTATTPACDESANGNCSSSQHRLAIFPVHGDVGAPPGETLTSAGIGIVVGTNAVCVMEHASFHLPCLLRYETALSGWTHIAVVVQDRVPRLYLDGVLVRTGVQSPKDYVFASWNVVGQGSTLGGYEGDLDEMAVYDRALSGAEIAALFNAGSAGQCAAVCPRERSDDAWQGATVTAHTGLRSSSPDGLFGATNVSPEVNTLLFADNQPDGTVHAVEWQTAAPFYLGGFGLAAIHEPDTAQRSFRYFKLQARMPGGSYVTVFEAPQEFPYAPGGRELDRCVHTRPLRAQQFRAEFTQNGPPGFSGPRVIELDAVTSERIFADGFQITAGDQP
ncbi:LamG domain-containing protein [Tahibacter sp. UC22_41]|uniref:LamG domain-containing protein n=1 Tax=Tahibacter sp. UC22_41 TaxID=3350178 RepID=UPI0036DB6DE5